MNFLSESAKNFLKKSFVRNNKELLLLLSIFLFLKIILLLKTKLIGWDESVYLAMGKYLYSSGEIGLFEGLRPIGLPLLLGLFWKLKLDYFIFSEILINLFALGNLILVYLIANHFWNKKVAFYASLLLVITPIFFIYSSLVFPHLPASFFALLSVFLLIKNKIPLAGLMAGISFLFRFPLGIVLISSIIFLFINKRTKDSFVFFLFWFIPVIPYLIANFFLYGENFTAIFFPFTQAIVFHEKITALNFLEKIFYYPIYLFKINFLLLIGSTFGLVYFFKKRNFKKKNLIIFFPLLFFFIYYSYLQMKDARYLLDFLPYLAIFSGFFIFQVSLFLKRKFKFTIFILIVLSLFIFSISQPQKYLPFYPFSTNEKLIEVYTFPNQLEENLFLTNLPMPAAYTNKKFIGFYPSLEDFDLVINQYQQLKKEAGYFIYFNGFYPCKDIFCQIKKEEFEKMILNEGTLIKNLTFFSQKYYIITLKYKQKCLP